VTARPAMLGTVHHDALKNFVVVLFFFFRFLVFAYFPFLLVLFVL